MRVGRTTRVLATQQLSPPTYKEPSRTPTERCPNLQTERSIQQRSTATTARSNAFGSILMRADQCKQGFMRRLRGVRDEEVTGPVGLSCGLISLYSRPLPTMHLALACSRPKGNQRRRSHVQRSRKRQNRQSQF
jgi:hypothetical protein